MSIVGVRNYSGLSPLAKQVSYNAGHMEMPKPGLLRLPHARVPDLAKLNDQFYVCTLHDIEVWARENNLRINKTATTGSEILWLHHESFAPLDNHIAVMVFVPRPRPIGYYSHYYTSSEGIKPPENPRFKAVIKTPVGAGNIMVDSVIEVAVGDSIILQAGQTLHGWRQESGRPMDVSILYNQHFVESREGHDPDPDNWIE